MYEKLSVKSFKESLAQGKYDSPTAARRAVGRASTLSETEKDQCRRVIDQHFGASPAPTKAAKTPKAEKAKSEKAPRATKAKAAKAERKARRNGGHAALQPSLFGEVAGVAGSLDDFTNLTTQMKIAERTIQNTGSALGTLIEAKKICPDADLSSDIEAASAVLSSAVNIFRGVTHKVTSHMASEANERIRQEGSALGAGHEESV